MMTIVTGLRHLTTAGLNLLLPPQCTFCLAEMTQQDNVGGLCHDCRCRLLPQEGPCCLKCGAPVPAETASSCARCIGRRLYFEGAAASGLYQDHLREAVLRMKAFQGEPLTATMARLMVKRLHDRLNEWEPELVVPIPIHWTRRIMRGTNSPDILAQRVARHLRIPCAGDLLRFRRNIKKQSTLTPSERFRNVRGAFRVSSGYDIRGSRLLVIDDILTTGATTSEAARILRRAGAAIVTVAVLARSVGADW